MALIACQEVIIEFKLIWFLDIQMPALTGFEVLAFGRTAQGFLQRYDEYIYTSLWGKWKWVIYYETLYLLRSVLETTMNKLNFSQPQTAL
jgi:hypothetical protein